MSDVTRILTAIEEGDVRAVDKLFPLVYQELRQLATQRLSNEPPGQTFQATALVHEAYLRLVGVDRAQHWDSRRHFFAAAAESMRRILIEHARRKKRLKRGGKFERADLPDVAQIKLAPLEELIDLDEALKKLALEDPEKAEVVNLRFFAGFSLEEISEVLGIAVQPSEADVFWDEFLRSLADRGLRGTRLIIADDHKGLKAAAAKVLGATVQRCRVHFMRNALACVGKKDRPIVTRFEGAVLRPAGSRRTAIRDR